MELRHLRYFTALSDRLNFTAAAAQVHVTQSTLSHQIKQLEDELGQRLFERNGKRVVMTEAGESFLGFAAQALREIDQGIRTLKQDRSELTSELRMGATHSFCVGLLPTCLASFLTKYHSICVSVAELNSNTIYSQLRDGLLDIAVVYRPGVLDDLSFEPLYNDELVLAVPKTHPFASRRRVRMVELHRQRLVLPLKEFGTRHMLDDYFRSIGAEPVVIAETNSIAPALALARKISVGVIASEYAVSEMQGLQVLRLESPTPVRTAGILWKRGNREARNNAAVRSFVATIRKTTAASKVKAAK